MQNNFAENEKKILTFWEEIKLLEKLREKNKKTGKPFGKAQGKRWSFLDGPITANNPMGVHHAWGRTYKDMFERYKAMQGYNCRFQNGFDCQGLWVEVEVEKELGFKTKKDIEAYGIEKFVNRCKERVHKYSKIQTEQSIRLGMLKDWGNWQTNFDEKGEWLKQSHSYYTMSDENNYVIWHFLKKCNEKGLLYKGRDVVPWCPRCGTAISQHEILTEEYKEITHKAVYAKFRLLRPSTSSGLAMTKADNVYFLVWTTTPWTLPGNVALAVNPDFDYCIVKIRNSNLKSQNLKPQLKTQNLEIDEKYILLREKTDAIFGKCNYEIEKEIKGKELAGLEYEGIFDDVPAVAKCVRSDTFCNGDDFKESSREPSFKEPSSLQNKDEGNLVPYKHKVILWDEVSKEEGTGIVHIAPGCGQEDYQLSKELSLSTIDVSDQESNYREGFGELSGKFVGSEKVRNWIFKNLESKGLIFKIEDYKHRYPTCWRCKTELIFRLVDEWYIAMTASLNSKLKTQNSKIKKRENLREQLIETAKQINWMPGFCLERELDWLKNMQDWLISKKRYWGLALPIWECECGNFEVVGSKKELKEKAVSGWKEFSGYSPHRPWIDTVKIKCSKCGKIISRIPDVGNPWLDAGIVPFSTISGDNWSDNIPYFHNKKDEWQKWFPVELVCESFPGQFKNWFYVLLVMSQVLEGENYKGKAHPFKNLLGFASVVDEKGEEMHKSKGNAIWFDDAVEKIGADVMRWMYLSQNPANNLRFGYNAAKETQKKILTLWNSFVFFKTYVLKKEFSICQEPLASLAVIPSELSNFQFSDNFQLNKFSNILDRWIISRLNGLIKTATECLDKFDAMKASQAIEDFWTQDLSLWYIRRSRKRFQQPDNPDEKEEAEKILYFILLTLSRLLAPMMPFLAEEMYQGLKSDSDSESVHLCKYPIYDEKLIDKQLGREMAQVREIVSLTLAKRAELKIPVRQALAKLKIKNEKLKTTIKNEKLLELVREEVNVKGIVFDDTIKDEIELDVNLTDELKQEGQAREIIRHIQDLRKKAGLTPQDWVTLHYSVSKELGCILEKNKKQVLETTKSRELKENAARQGDFLAQKEAKVGEIILWLALSQV